MKKSKKKKLIIKQNRISEKLFIILGFQLGLGGLFINSYSGFKLVFENPYNFYIYQNIGVFLIAIVSVAFCITSIGYLVIGYFSNENLNDKKSIDVMKVMLKSNNHRISRSKSFLIQSVSVFIICLLIFMNLDAKL